jgi:hypothetical protein
MPPLNQDRKSGYDIHMAVDFGRDIVFRGDGADAKLLARFREAGAAAVVFSSPGADQLEACRKSGLEALPAGELQFLSWKEIGSAKPGLPAVLAEGLWPGMARAGVGSRDEVVASASRQPWVDANGFWIGCLRAVAPERPAVIAYLPDEKAGLAKDRVVPFESAELALAEAWTAGGNCILALEPRFRDALAAGDAQAAAAWSRLARTAAWLRQNAAWFRRPTMPAVTALIAPGTDSAELANLMYRQAVSPALASALDPPRPSPDRILVLLAASIGTPPLAIRNRILAHASAGATVVVDAPAQGAWWRVAGLTVTREQEDRVFHKLGRGVVLAYRQPVEDPSEFAFDVIDLVTHARRAVRIWGAPAAVPLLTQAREGEARLVVVNYGSGSPQFFREIMVHVHGFYSRALLERPEGAPVEIPVLRRGPVTELRLPALGRVATVGLS